MPQKRKRQAASLSSPAAKKKTQSRTTLSDQLLARNLSARSQATRAKALHVLSDLRRDPDLALTQAAKNREISPRSVWRYIGSELKQGRPWGRIRVTKFDRLRATLHIPSTKPDVLIPIHTKRSRERYLVGEWFASINEAARGDFARLNRFPKQTFIDGVRLPTGTYEVQRIVECQSRLKIPHFAGRKFPTPKL